MLILREVVLWIAGVMSGWCIGFAVGAVLNHLTTNSYVDLSNPLAFGFSLLFVCMRLWVLDARSSRRTS